MTLEDKIALCSGESFWRTKKFEKYGINPLFLSDGPHGLRKQEGKDDMLGINESRDATCFPAEVTTASSWDEQLLSEIGQAIGKEAKDQGVDVVLGPGANLKRNPLCGRNFEYFSEDPYLAGKLAAGFIRGVEGEGTGSCLKHFAANSREKGRFNSDSVMDERTLRELYLKAFEIAVKEGKPSTVMCAYPKLNGVHCSDNKYLLGDILRGEWGFDGVVVTDWGAMNDRIEGFKAGCDLNMPGGSAYMEKDVLKAVESGELSEEFVDRSAERILKLIEKCRATEKDRCKYDYTQSHLIAKKAAAEGAVLLKNEGKILPIKGGEKVALIGRMAKDMRYQGMGSSHINPTKLSQPIDFIKADSFCDGYNEKGETDDDLIAEAKQKASGADIAVVFCGLPANYEAEGVDRKNMALPDGQIRLIGEVCRANENTVVVLMCGCAVECPFFRKVKAMLYLGLPGQAGGEAVADILYGRENPSGKLAESWALSYRDVPSHSFFSKTKDVLYNEGIYAGYRYFDKAAKQVLFPFGHGLSYTEFEYSQLEIDGNTVTFKIKNTGSLEGKEVAQLYVEAPQTGIHRPIRELRRFKKISLKPGEEKTVVFELEDRDFAVWDEGWKVQQGTYAVCVGTNSRDLPLRAEIFVEGEEIPMPEKLKGTWYENCQGEPTAADLEKAMGRKYVPVEAKKGSFTMDNTIGEMKDDSVLIKMIYKIAEIVIARQCGGKKDYDDPEYFMMMSAVDGCPLRSTEIACALKGNVAHALLDFANGHAFNGIKKLLKISGK
ncbi:MAG: glycoside hydrolase family 3 protein [Clostridia bacterium]|nr:glycoside hydrolase family 3 protein [Clostridia bacterium]